MDMGVKVLKQKRIKWITVVSSVLLLSIIVSLKVSAVQYGYDDLNRLILVEEESGETTHYEYDAAGNLLSMETTPASAGGATSAVMSTYGVSEGWTPYFTSGVVAEYSVDAEVVYADVQEPTVTDVVYMPGESSAWAVQRIAAEAAVPGGANVYKDIAVAGPQAYSIKGWIKAASLEQAAAQVIVNYYDERDRLVGYENAVNILAASDWTSFEKELTIPEGTAKARIHLQLLMPQANGAGNALFAAIHFEPSQAP